MSTTSGTPAPRLPDTGRPDTEAAGPDATPEQEALVRGLLAGLRADDPPMPDHVVARIEAALAEERRTAAAAAAAAPGGPATAQAATEEADEHPATVTVLPQRPARRRPDRSSTALQWLVGAAAAVLVVGGVGAVVSGTFGGSSADTAASGALGEAQERVVATGTVYDQDTLAAQVRALVADPAALAGAEGGTPEPAPAATTDASGSAEPGTPDQPGTTALPGDSAAPGGTAAPAVEELSATALAGCVAQLAGEPGVEPVVVDQARYEGRAALVVVIVTPGDPATLDVFVVSTDCDQDSGDVYEFQRVARP